LAGYTVAHILEKGRQAATPLLVPAYRLPSSENLFQPFHSSTMYEEQPLPVQESTHAVYDDAFVEPLNDWTTTQLDMESVLCRW